MKKYVKILEDTDIVQNMSRRGNYHDNSVMENFFGMMKQEMYYGHTYSSFEDLKEAITKYIKYYKPSFAIKNVIFDYLPGETPHF